MTTLAHAFAILSLSVLMACNSNADNDKDADKDMGASTESSSNTSETAPANRPKSYTATFTPDSAILGKSNEVLVRITGATAVALTDPDGNDNGIEFVVKLQATNKGQIGKDNSISVSYTDARLQLDNGTTISAQTGSDYLRADPESSSDIESWTFEVPAGAKPTTLNLFMNGTRASISLALK